MSDISPRLSRPAIALAAPLTVAGAHAGALDPGESDWPVRGDNTLKLGFIGRTAVADPALVESFRLLVPDVPASAFPQVLNFNAGNNTTTIVAAYPDSNFPPDAMTEVAR